MERIHAERAGGFQSDLIDISDFDLSALRSLPHSAFGESLRRILDEWRMHPMAYAVFDRSVGGHS